MDERYVQLSRTSSQTRTHLSLGTLRRKALNKVVFPAPGGPLKSSVVVACEGRPQQAGGGRRECVALDEEVEVVVLDRIAAQRHRQVVGKPAE